MTNRPSVDPELVRFAVEIAREAGELTLSSFRDADLDLKIKTDGTPVTAADLAAEQLLRKRICATFPDDSVLGEEEMDINGTSGRTWILDPIDGTQSFVRGVPLYGNLVSLEDQNGPALGVANIPALEQCLWAGRGLGCFLNGSPAKVSDRTELSGSCIVTSSLEYWQNLTGIEKLLELGTTIRTWGDAYGYVLVATGQVEAMLDPIVNRWDVAPFLTILSEAGGVFTDFNGIVSDTSGSGIAANPILHSELLKYVHTSKAATDH